MRGGWSRFGLYLGVVAVVIVLVVLATSGAERTVAEIGAQAVFIGGLAYLITFAVWPRRKVASKRSAPDETDGKRTSGGDKTRPRPDARPVMVIGHRPAGSAPGAQVHARETPRSARGRRPGPRQPTGEMRWPTS